MGFFLIVLMAAACAPQPAAPEEPAAPAAPTPAADPAHGAVGQVYLSTLGHLFRGFRLSAEHYRARI